MRANQDAIGEAVALFLAEHFEPIARELIDGYVAEHPESKSSNFSRTALEEWTREEIDELCDALQGKPTEPRGELLYAGDLVKGGSALFMPMANYVETKLIVGGAVAAYLWEHAPGTPRHIQRCCEALEAATLRLIRENLQHYAASALRKGRLMQYWTPPFSDAGESPASPRDLSDETTRALTRQEERVLKLAVQGKTNGEIASALGIAQNTVKNHLAHIYDKLAVSNRTELTRKFYGL